jgi:transposase
VRVDQANLLRQQPSARKVLKSSRWLLLRNRNKLQANKQCSSRSCWRPMSH